MGKVTEELVALITQQIQDHGIVVWYDPEQAYNDGVRINMAPRYELIPSWQAELKKCWEALARGDYDWAHQAMDHWPDRVRDKCKTNRSYAIAHGLA